MMRRVLVAAAAGAAAAAVAGTETWRRGYAAPCLFGARQWGNACLDLVLGYHPTWTDEPEITV